MSLTKVSYSMIQGEWLNVLDYGAVGNGIADDTAAIQATIDAAIANGKWVYIPVGTYSVTTLLATFTHYSSFVIQGEGQYNAVLQKRGSTQTPVLALEGENALGIVYWGIKDLYIEGNGKTVSDCVGLQLHHCSRGHLENLFIQNNYIGLECQGSEQFVTRNTMFRNNGYGANLAQGDAFINICNLVTFDKCTFVTNTLRGANLAYAAGCAFTDCVFEKNGTSADFNTGALYVDNIYASLAGFSTLSVTRCWFENGYGHSIYTEPGANICTTLTIRDCLFIQNERGLDISSIRTLGVYDTLLATVTDISNIASTVGGFFATDSTFYTLNNSCTSSILFNYGTSAVSEPTNLGQWTAIPYVAGDFTASGSMTWTVDAGDLLTFEKSILGKTLTLNLAINSSSVGGVASTNLIVKLPTGAVSSSVTRAVGFAYDKTAYVQVFASTAVNGTTVTLTKLDGTNWTATSTNQTDVSLTMIIPIK